MSATSGRTPSWVRNPSVLTPGKRVRLPPGGHGKFPSKGSGISTDCEIVDSSNYAAKAGPSTGAVLVKALGMKGLVPSDYHWIQIANISHVFSDDSDDDDGHTPMDHSGESEQDEQREDGELAAMSGDDEGPTDARAKRLAARRATRAAEESSDEARGDHLMNLLFACP